MFTCENATVVLRNINKNYEVKSSNPNLFNPFRRTATVPALQDISLVASRGDSVGVLGHNGSGKSTLMRIMAGSEGSTSGDVMVSSAPTLLSVSAALQPNLTGLQNVRIGLLAQGLTPGEVAEAEGGVAEFASIGDAIERPMATYSSGMSARLKFAISTAVNRDILLIDEALATGDATFSAKAEARMDEFLSNAGTMFLVSHQSSSIMNFCNRVVWLHKGELIADGETRYITKTYRSWASWEAQGEKDKAEAIIHRMQNRYQRPEILLSSDVVDYLDRVPHENSPH